MSKTNRNNRDGFTLIELLLVMVIIGILSYGAMMTFIDFTSEAQYVEKERDTATLSDAASLYFIEKDEWPITTSRVITDHGVGNVDVLYPLNERKLKGAVTGISHPYSEYGLAISGKYEGQVFHVPSTRVANRYQADRPNEKQPVTFMGQNYADIDDVPATDEKLFSFRRLQGTYELAGIDQIYLFKHLKGKIPRDIVIPSEYRGKPVVSIGDFAFKGRGIQSLVIPSSVRSVGYQSFISNQLETLVIPNTVTEIASQAFYGNKLHTVTLPESVTRIQTEAFRNNQLQAIALPSKLTLIGDGAFAYNQLNDLTIPATVQTIGSRAFNSNQLPDDQAVIYARKDDGNNASTTIPDLTTVVSYGGKKRDGVVIPDTVTTLVTRAYHGNALTRVTVPRTVTTIGPGAFNANELPDDNAFFYKRLPDGSDDTSVLVSYGGANKVLTVFPASITTLAYASLYNTSLKEVRLPQSISRIEASAFGWNDLTELVVPESIHYIGNSAFSSCPITKITIEGATTRFGTNVFINNGPRRNNNNLDTAGATGDFVTNKVGWHPVATAPTEEEPEMETEDVPVEDNTVDETVGPV